MTVSIVIPHWNRCAVLAELVQSIKRQVLPAGVELEVVVVDNGSTDGSAVMARQQGANVLELGRNEGVSRAFNRGIRASAGEWVALVNNDIELAPDWLAELLQALADPQVWFATGKILNYRSRTLIDGAGDAICRGGTSWRLGHNREDGPAFATSRRTYFPAATATVFRREFFERAGFFEESLFAYLEDVDLGLRAALADLPGVYVPEAVAYHRSGETAGRWSRSMVEWLTCHQILLLAKFYPAGMLVRNFRPIVTAQVLWALMALSRGRLFAWCRGLARGIRAFRGLRRASRALRAQPQRLELVLRSAESEIARIQQATGWDTYWKWYFRLSGLPQESGS